MHHRGAMVLVAETGACVSAKPASSSQPIPAVHRDRPAWNERKPGENPNIVLARAARSALCSLHRPSRCTRPCSRHRGAMFLVADPERAAQRRVGDQHSVAEDRARGCGQRWPRPPAPRSRAAPCPPHVGRRRFGENPIIELARAARSALCSRRRFSRCRRPCSRHRGAMFLVADRECAAPRRIDAQHLRSQRLVIDVLA